MTGGQDALVELPPGYTVDPVSGAWTTLPWPGDPALPYGDPSRLALLPPSLGPSMIAWAQRWLVHPLDGKPWRFTPGQARFMHLWWAIDPETGRWMYRSGVKRGAKGPIAHDTSVLTPQGWTTHGELRVGSQVYAIDGTITRVVALRSEVQEPTYRVSFRDGASVVCTGSHRWPVEVFNGSRRIAGIRTVHEMLETGLVYRRNLTDGRTKATKGGVARFKALPSPAVHGIAVRLPVHPYVFGYWLGDGDKDASRITAERDDMQCLLDELNKLGVEHGTPDHTHGETFRVRFGAGCAQAWLRVIGVLNNKHIPGWLLRASLEQRWAILQGLVDSDGHIDMNGNVEIALRDDQLAADVFQLAVSLGLMPTRTVGKSAFAGRAYSDRARIRFTPMPGEVVSRLPRKAERCRTAEGRTHRRPFSRSRTITAIESVDMRPARCLTVEHPSHVYLVGDRNVPTCNTGKDPLGAAMLWCMAAGPRQVLGVEDGRIKARPLRRALVQVGANSQDQAKKLLMVANAMVSDKMKLAYQVDAGLTRTVFGDGSRIELLKASEKSQEGDPATDVVLNEDHHMTRSNGGQALAEVARRNVAKSPSSIAARVLELTNAHQQGQESVAEASYNSWQSQVAGQAYRRDILYDSIEAPPGLSLFDHEEIMQGLRAAYCDAPWADLERLRDEILDARTSEAQTIRYYFNGLATAEDAWVDPRAFDDLARPGLVVDEGEQIVLFLDCSKSGDATALSGCRLSDGHVMSLGCWQPRHGEQVDGWLAPREDVDAAVREAFARWKVVWFGVDPSPAEDDETAASYWMPTIDAWHRDFARKVSLWATPGAGGHSVLFDMRLSARGGRDRNRMFTEAAMQTAQDIDEDESLTHDGDPMLRRHVHNARRRPNQWGITVGKINRSSRHLVDYSVTMIGARMGRRVALNSPKVRKARKQRKAVTL